MLPSPAVPGLGLSTVFGRAGGTELLLAVPGRLPCPSADDGGGPHNPDFSRREQIVSTSLPIGISELSSEVEASADEDDISVVALDEAEAKVRFDSPEELS